MTTSPKELTSTLKEQGYRLTPQRCAVLEVLTSSGKYLTPAEIHGHMKLEDNGIGLATVYRTIDILVALGLVRQIHGKGGVGYVSTRRLEHHHYLICSSCSAIVDFTECELEDLEQRLSLETGFDIEEHFLEVWGLCHECQSKV